MRVFRIATLINIDVQQLKQLLTQPQEKYTKQGFLFNAEIEFMVVYSVCDSNVEAQKSNKPTGGPGTWKPIFDRKGAKIPSPDFVWQRAVDLAKSNRSAYHRALCSVQRRPV